MLFYAFVVLSAVVGMEFMAWFTHKYVMHGFLWDWHEDHHLPHNEKDVVFYNLTDDGLVLSKHRGRTDVLNKWSFIKKGMLEKLKAPQKHQDNINLVYTKIRENDEWIIQAHSKTDYSKLSQKDFINSVKQYVIFSTKMKLNLLDKDIDEITLLEILNENLISATDTLDESGNGSK